jgi:hypothetical protein
MQSQMRRYQLASGGKLLRESGHRIAFLGTAVAVKAIANDIRTGSTLTVGSKLVTFSMRQNNFQQKSHLDGDSEQWRS